MLRSVPHLALCAWRTCNHNSSSDTRVARTFKLVCVSSGQSRLLGACPHTSCHVFTLPSLSSIAQLTPKGPCSIPTTWRLCGLCRGSSSVAATCVHWCGQPLRTTRDTSVFWVAFCFRCACSENINLINANGSNFAPNSPSSPLPFSLSGAPL